MFYTFWSTILVPDTTGATLDVAKDLHTNLTSGYNKYLRPVMNQSEAVNVTFILSLIALQELDEVLERFSVVCVLATEWTDENFVWNPANYGGINYVFMGYDEVWVPEIIITNPAEKLDSGRKMAANSIQF